MSLFMTIALKWEQPIEYVLERGMNTIWTAINIMIYNPEEIDEEAIQEERKDTWNAYLRAQAIAREKMG